MPFFPIDNIIEEGLVKILLDQDDYVAFMWKLEKNNE